MGSLLPLLQDGGHAGELCRVLRPLPPRHRSNGTQRPENHTFPDQGVAERAAVRDQFDEVPRPVGQEPGGGRGRVRRPEDAHDHRLQRAAGRLSNRDVHTHTHTHPTTHPLSFFFPPYSSLPPFLSLYFSRSLSLSPSRSLCNRYPKLLFAIASQ